MMIVMSKLLNPYKMKSSNDISVFYFKYLLIINVVIAIIITMLVLINKLYCFTVLFSFFSIENRLTLPLLLSGIKTSQSSEDKYIYI